MGKHTSVLDTRGSKKHKSSEKVLPPGQEFALEQDDKRKEMGCTFKGIKHSSEISDQVGGASTQECETGILCSQAEDEEEINLGGTDCDKYSHDINTCLKPEENSNTAESDDNICGCPMGKNSPNKMYNDASNPSDLEKKPAVSKNIVVKYLFLALIIISEFIRLRIIGECMELVWQERYIFTVWPINAAAIGTETYIFCTACFVYFILARISLLNTLMILSSCQLSRELLAIGASKDIDDNGCCCVFCAKEVPVKNVDDLKKGQHLTRPGQSKCSWCFLYKHHMLVTDIKFLPNETVELTLIHMTKVNGQIGLYETREKICVPDQNLYIVLYNSPMYSPEESIDCAKSSANRIPKPECYNLFSNNCETVVRGFKGGSKISLQVRNFFEIIANILMFIFWITSRFMSWYICVAIFFYCILIYLAVDLKTYCQNKKIICGFHCNIIRCKLISYLLAIVWLTYVFIISSLN